MTAPMRVLVVDDSSVNRHLITEAIDAADDLRVVGHAGNGEQALRMVAELQPDAITLDVEMPKMDGFTFLRILMSSRPTAVIVLSSYSARENILRALELGAADFMAKPEQLLLGQPSWGGDLILKLRETRQWRRPPRLELPVATPHPDRKRPDQSLPRFVVGMAASTGGPGALLSVLSQIPSTYPGAILVAQHMAHGFTRSFAERLNRTTPLCVREAVDGEPLFAGHVYVCPGGTCMELRREGGTLKLAIVPPVEADRYVPSATRMFRSMAHVLGSRALAIVLTGMADDGVEGCRAIREHLGVVIAESEETAVVFGMPGAVQRANLASHVAPLPDIPALMRGFRRATSTDPHGIG